MPDIKAGTTGKALVLFYTAPGDCVFCWAAGTCGFTSGSLSAPGWDASYDDETVTVPPEAIPGDYDGGFLPYMTVRAASSIIGDCPAGSAPCKHLAFTVLTPDLPPDGPGPGPGC